MLEVNDAVSVKSDLALPNAESPSSSYSSKSSAATADSNVEEALKWSASECF
ncbi:hypothetical protein ONS96_005038 [Cadophora gregata f. sp. sojae]|nr:hypothetical protein ONS96_005038 [Cadophora gregata f. sp. sojae]